MTGLTDRAFKTSEIVLAEGHKQAGLVIDVEIQEPTGAVRPDRAAAVVSDGDRARQTGG